MHAHSRRGFLVRLLGPCFAGAGILEQALFRATQARAQARMQTRGSQPWLFDVEQAAEGVYLALARPAPVLNCNAAIFVNSDDILIVDAHSKPSAVAALVAQIRDEISAKPVRYVVNTHFHWDHVQGTSAYLSADPGVKILATTKTRELIASHSAKRVAASVERMRSSLEDFREQAGAASDASHRAYFERMASETQSYIGEMTRYVPELPNVTFGDHLVIHDKAHDLHLLVRGRAHTASDVVVFCPQKRVIASADLLTGFIPGMGDGYPTEWPATLGRVSELKFDLVMPGHGGMQRGRKRLRQLSAYIEETTEIVRRRKEAGDDLPRIERMVRPETLRSIRAGDYGDYLAESIAQYRFLAPGAGGPDSMAAAITRNVGEIYRFLDR